MKTIKPKMLCAFLIALTTTTSFNMARAMFVPQSTESTYDLKGRCIDVDDDNAGLAEVELKLVLVDTLASTQSVIETTTSDMAGNFLFTGLNRFKPVPDVSSPRYLLLARCNGYETIRVQDEFWKRK